MKTKEGSMLSNACLAECQMIERCVPAHMIALMLHKLRREGWTLRVDVMKQLDAAVAGPLARLDPLTALRLAARIDRLAEALLYDLAPEDVRHGILAVCYWVLRLVEEGVLQDKDNQAVLIALLLVEDAKASPEEWGYREQRARVSAEGLLSKARLSGYFIPTQVLLKEAAKI